MATLSQPVRAAVSDATQPDPLTASHRAGAS